MTTTPTTETKSERLILNFTVQERHRLKELYLKSHSASESDFVRKAVELFADLHARTVAGGEIIMRNEAEKERIHLPILKVWNRTTMPVPGRETPRRNFELKVVGFTKEQIMAMVEAGAAPSAARLAWTAIGIYALVLERKEQGFVLMEARGQSLISIDGSATSPQASEPTPTGPAITRSVHQGTDAVTPVEEDEDVVKLLRVRKISWVLANWEGAPPRPRRRWWITTLNPLLCREGNDVAVLMKKNLLMLNDYLPVFSSASKLMLNELVRAIHTKLAVKIGWDDYTAADRSLLLGRMEQPGFANFKKRYEKNPNSSETSPVWLLVRGIELKEDSEGSRKTIDFATLERAIYVHPCWICEAGATATDDDKSFLTDDEHTERSGYLLKMKKDDLGNRIPVGAVEMDDLILDDQLDLLSGCMPVCLIDHLADALKKSSANPRPSAASPTAKPAPEPQTK